MIKLDKKDRRILLELETNARQSAAQIARKAGLSEEVVNYRIKKYLASGIIKKFLIIPLFDRLGFTTYRVYMQYKATTPEKEQEVVDYIREKMPCQWLGICDGRWDLIARISARDTFEFNNIMDAFLEKYGGVIGQKEVTIQLRHTWWPSTYGLTGEAGRKEPLHEIPRGVKRVKHDGLDMRIMSVLIERARLPTVEIAKEVGASADTVHYRIKRLMHEGVITRVKSYFDREKMGYQHHQVLARFTQDLEGRKRFIAMLNRFPNCFFISSMVGVWDIEFGIDARNSIEFHELLGRIKEKFPEVIREYETFVVYREHAPNPFRYFLKQKD